MKYTFLLFTFFLSLPNIISAQDNNLCYLTLFMTADDEKVERAKFYNIARENIKVEFSRIVFKNGESNYGKRYYATYNSDKNAWTAIVPKGMYRFRTQHLGFDNFRETIECEMPTLTIKKTLKTSSLPYTFDKGQKYDYIRGAIEFSETIVVHFKSGAADENKAFLESFPHEKIQKIRFINSFLLTLNLANQESLPEILMRETYGDEPLAEGFYFGDAVTKTIEKITENPNVNYADPSFIFSKNNLQILSAKDFSNKNWLINELKSRNPDEALRLNPNDFKKSDELIQKELRDLEEK
jgi:hypothetical protein